MSWGYSDEPAAEATAISGDGERVTMFSNDGFSSNNTMVKGLLEKGYAMEDVQDAIEMVQSAIQRGMAPSEMPRGVLPHAEAVELYDEAATQAGAPKSDEIEAQKAAERDQAMELARENLRGGASMVGAAVGGSIGLISAGSLNDIRNLTRNPDLQMTIAEEGAKLAHHTEMDDKNHSLAELGGMSAPNVNTQQRSTEMGIG